MRQLREDNSAPFGNQGPETKEAKRGPRPNTERGPKQNRRWSEQAGSEEETPAEAAAREHQERLEEIDEAMADLGLEAESLGLSLGVMEIERIGQDKVLEQSSRWSKIKLAFTGKESKAARLVKMGETVAYKNLDKLEGGLGKTVVDLKTNLAKHESESKKAIKNISGLEDLDPNLVEEMWEKMEQESEGMRGEKDLKVEELSTELETYPVAEKEQRVGELIKEYGLIMKEVIGRRLAVHQKGLQYDRAVMSVDKQSQNAPDRDSFKEIVIHLNAQIIIMKEQHKQLLEREEQLKKRLSDLRAEQTKLQPFVQRLDGVGLTQSERARMLKEKRTARLGGSAKFEPDRGPQPNGASPERPNPTGPDTAAKEADAGNHKTEATREKTSGEKTKSPEGSSDREQYRMPEQWVADIKEVFAEMKMEVNDSFWEKIMTDAGDSVLDAQEAEKILVQAILNNDVKGFGRGNVSAVQTRAQEIIAAIVSGTSASEATQNESDDSAEREKAAKEKAAKEEETRTQAAAAQAKKSSAGGTAPSPKTGPEKKNVTPEKVEEKPEVHATAEDWAADLADRLGDKFSYYIAGNKNHEFMENFNHELDILKKRKGGEKNILLTPPQMLQASLKIYFDQQFQAKDKINDLVARDILTKFIIDHGKLFNLDKKPKDIGGGKKGERGKKVFVYDQRAARRLANEMMQEILADEPGLRQHGEFPTWEELHVDDKK